MRHPGFGEMPDVGQNQGIREDSKMKNQDFARLAGIFWGLLALCACGGKEVAQPQEQMAIAVDFREVHRCSRISPEITVAYAPKGTKFYDVRLVEEGANERFLGGGTWAEDGSGLIPEGALTRHYVGPCPPKDRETIFTYVVSAMEKENGQPLAVRLYKFDPNSL